MAASGLYTVTGSGVEGKRSPVKRSGIVRWHSSWENSDQHAIACGPQRPTSKVGQNYGNASDPETSIGSLGERDVLLGHDGRKTSYRDGTEAVMKHRLERSSCKSRGT